MNRLNYDIMKIRENQRKPGYFTSNCCFLVLRALVCFFIPCWPVLSRWSASVGNPKGNVLIPPYLCGNQNCPEPEGGFLPEWNATSSRAPPEFYGKTVHCGDEYDANYCDGGNCTMGLRTGPHHYEYHGTMPVLNCLFDNDCGAMQVVQVLSALLANWATSYGEPPFGLSVTCI